MEGFKQNAAAVMAFLKTNSFSHSIISLHKCCYEDLQRYLSDSMIEYSGETAYRWIESNRQNWNYRKFTGYRHCIDQLEDVFQYGAISLDHLGPRASAYSLLNDYYKSILDPFLETEPAKFDDSYRISCSRFLLYLQTNSIDSISCLNYDLILKFHAEDYHRSSKSKDIYEDHIRRLLRYLAEKGMCGIGLSLALNRLLIHKIIRIPDHVIMDYRDDDPKSCKKIAWDVISDFLSEMEKTRYKATVLKASKHILTLLYIFTDMHKTALSTRLLWYWFDAVRPTLGTGWMQHRRALCQFLEYLNSGQIVTKITGDPKAVKTIDKLPEWQSGPLKEYLCLLKREGREESTIAMQRSSNIRFCKYLQRVGLKNFSEVSRTVLKDFHLQDLHSTPEGKAAYNCRIRGFLIYLYEQELVKDPYLYKVLPTIVSQSTTLVQTLSKEEVAAIWAVNPESLGPKALRDYAMVCIGLTMGFRASDIASLRFENIDWKGKSIRIVQQKTGRLITMPMPVKTGNILFRYLRDGRPSSEEPYIFIRHEAPYDRIQRGACRRALKRFLSIPPNGSCSFHSVRKTFATQLLSGSTKLELISDSLGHSTNGTVHKYLSLDEERMRFCALSLEDTGISYKGGVFHV